MAKKYAKRAKKGIKKAGSQPIQPYLMDDGTYLGEIVVTATKAEPTKRQKKRAARKEKRLKLAEIRIEANIDRLYNKLETVEQKRDPYSRGGVAKAN